jgi:hypothetical protein
MMVATKGMPVRALPAPAPPPAALQVAAAKSSSRGWLGGLLHDLFSSDDRRAPAPVRQERQPAYRPGERPAGW